MMKLIKLSDTHYIVVDDSERNSGDLVFCLDVHYNNPMHPPEKYINPIRKRSSGDNCNSCKKTTHSTQPLEGVQTIPLPEVEELIYGYNVEKMAREATTLIHYDNRERENCMNFYIEGFKAHQKLVKDKLFTVEDMEQMFNNGKEFGIEEGLFSFGHLKSSQCSQPDFQEAIKKFLPKTEWEIIFDEQGKLKLI